MAVRVPMGALRQVGTLSSPGTPVADGDGGFTQTYSSLDPAEWRFAIERATVRSVERQFAGTLIAKASYILTGRFHSGITTETRIVWVDRAGVTHTANVLAVDDTEGAGVQTVVLVSEVVP
jgi:head-tail adaptor